MQVNELWLSAHDHSLSSKTWRGFSQEATAPAQRFSPPPLAPVRGQPGRTYQSRRGHVPARPRPRPQRPPAPGSPAVTEPPWEQLGSDSGAPLRREAAETRELASKRCQCSSSIGPSLHKPPEPSSLRSFKLAAHAQSCPRNPTGSKPFWARPSPFSLTVPPFSAHFPSAHSFVSHPSLRTVRAAGLPPGLLLGGHGFGNCLCPLSTV